MTDPLQAVILIPDADRQATKSPLVDNGKYQPLAQS